MKKGHYDTDRGMDAIIKELTGLGQYSVKAGIPESTGKEGVDGVTVAQYAAWNEYGVAKKDGGWHIPPRPFVTGWVENKTEEIKRIQETLVKSVSEGKLTAEKAVELLGQFAQDGIKQYIKTGDFVSNAESTIRAKNSSTPLIDTGTMMDSISFEIKKDGK